MAITNRMLVVGDSHSCFWTGHNNRTATISIFAGIDVLHVGPATAFSLGSDHSSTQAASKLAEHLARSQGVYGCVMFCFGEIDCRNHIIRNALANSTNISVETQKVVDRYFAFVRHFRETQDVPCVIWGPTASSTDGPIHFHPELPAAGSNIERNYASFLFNSYLKEAAGKVEGIEHCSIFENMLDARYVTKPEYLYDGCHVSNRALPEAESALRKSLERLGILSQMEPIFQRPWPISDAIGLRNVAEGAKYTSSTTWKGFFPRPFGATPMERLPFHTHVEDSAHIIISLDAAYVVRRIEVHNRADAYQERAESLAIAMSMNGKEYFDVFAPEGQTQFGSDLDRLVVPVLTDLPVRFVKFYLRDRNCLHLQHVSIHALSFLTE